jgi:hypothetical protein
MMVRHVPVGQVIMQTLTTIGMVQTALLMMKKSLLRQNRVLVINALLNIKLMMVRGQQLDMVRVRIYVKLVRLDLVELFIRAEHARPQMDFPTVEVTVFVELYKRIRSLVIQA